MKKNKISKNYLEHIPMRREDIIWSVDDEGIVTLEMENKGIFNKIAQKLFKRPKISFIHLDEIGSFIWQLIDGEKNIIELGESVEKHFGEKAHPLYERLATYVQMLESYGFVTNKQNK